MCILYCLIVLTFLFRTLAVLLVLGPELCLNHVIYILPEIYFTNLYRFTETENLLYIDLKTCQYHSVHFRYNLYKLVSIFQVICILPDCFQLSETDNIHIS